MTTNSPFEALQRVWRVGSNTFSSVAGAGIDLVEIKMLVELLAASGGEFIDSGWSISEQNEAAGSPERLAAKWAAKESVMKAMQCGIGEIEPCDIEILTTANGAPSIVLHRSAAAAAARRGITALHVALTHEGGWAAAIVFANSDLDPNSKATATSKQDRGEVK